MSDAKRDDKVIKRDQRGPRDTREEVDAANEELDSGTVKPQTKNPNRDAARGDWDRTGDLHRGGAAPDVDNDEEA
jgi:hypothetical protein